MLKRISGPTREDVTEDLRKLFEEFLNLYNSPNVILVTPKQ
jgi:putative cell wall-binding protein